MPKISLTDKIDIGDRSKFELDANGYLNLDAIIARTGIQTYWGFELGDGFDAETSYNVYRAPDAVFNEVSLKSYDGAPITKNHPAKGVNASNYTDTILGQTIGAGVPFEDRLVKARLSIRDAAAINQLMRDGGSELSAGYHSNLIVEDGVTPDGTPYQARMSGIEINHIALVDAGRCGPECRVGDSAKSGCGCASCQSKEPIMATVKVTHDGVAYDASEQVAQVVTKLQGQITTLSDQTKALQDAKADLTAKNEELQGQVKALEADVKGAQLSDEQIDALVNERVDLVNTAKTVLGDEADLSNKSKEEIHRMTVANVHGADFVADQTASVLAGMFKVVTSDKARVAAPTGQSQGTVTRLQSRDALYADVDAKRSQRWKKGA